VPDGEDGVSEAGMSRSPLRVGTTGAEDRAGPLIIDNPAEMRAWSMAQHRMGRRVGLVPTMGALHRGHVALITHARASVDATVVSIFVNPLQFDRADDFDRYPRPIDADVAVCRELGVDVVYAPLASAMYEPGFRTTVTVGDLTTTMEGTARPGHFDGVTTVVTKLFTACRPDIAVFGEKDFQQLAVVRRLSADLDLGVEVIGHPTVREPDGLAMSSRNTRLDPDQRATAASIPAALDQAIADARSGERDAATITGRVQRALDALHGVRVDYVALFDPASLAGIARVGDDQRTPGRVRIAVAAFVGDVRLIDNRDLFER
jgi:pantoate--beta-alanine ligase